MKKIKGIMAGMAAFAMMVSLAACGGSAPAAESKSAASESTAAAESAAAESTAVAESTAAHAEVLVAFFSATGTTKGVAERIAAVTGGDLYEIVPAEPYTDEDLNYNDSSTRATMEQDDKNARPEIGSEDISLEGYTTVYLGFPIWWGEEPRILDTFVEKYDFEGITVVPFCTSGGSGIGRSGPNMEALAGSGTWLKGERLSAGVSEDEIRSWIEGLN
ncbi:MAG: flavodoxin [Lachnospiraceae bacterium]|nr:flavodoxin [Lachnospiraceae bacterium]